MNLCALCLADDVGRYDYDPQTRRYPPCCAARALAATPRRLMREAFAALTDGMPAEDVQAVRARAYALLGAVA